MLTHQPLDARSAEPRRCWIPGLPRRPEEAIVSLENLRLVTPREQAVARQVIAQVQALIAWRDQAVQEGELNALLDRPAGGWRLENPVNDFMDAYRLVSEGDARVLDLLRYYTGFFSGYKLIHFAPMAGLRSLMPLPDDVRGAIAANLAREEHYLDFYLRLKRCLPQRILVDPPWMLGEVGRNVEGVVVNRDTVRWQMTIATLWKAGVLDHLCRQVAEHGTAYVVEIGAGIGALGYHLKRIIPEITYLAVDIPESLVFSGIYLALTMPECQPTVHGPGAPPPREHGVSLTANFLFQDLLAQLPRVDLAVNLISMGEMIAGQVDSYARALSDKMRDTGLVFEGNDPRPFEDGAAMRDVFARHFTANERVDWTGIPQTAFERHEHHIATSVHANRPLETMIVPPGERRPLLADGKPLLLETPVLPAPTAKPGRLRQLWQRFRAQPLSRLPARVYRRLPLHDSKK